MRVEELARFGFPESFVSKLKDEKISELYPPQADIVRKQLYKDRNLVVTLPTAGGKTLIATLSIHHALTSSRGKIVYIVPLVALAYEKYSYFKKLFDGQHKTVISVGDFDSSDPWLANYDIIIVTSEKLDSLLRHDVDWIKQISLVVVDEIHLLNDSGRGPTLEILLTRLREVSPRAQILGLSATIKNSSELAKWLNATLLVSDFRPVKLYEGVCFNSHIEFFGKDPYMLTESEKEDAILQNTLGLSKQCLFFVSTRKNAESLAEQLAVTSRTYLKKNEALDLAKISDEALNVLEIPTKQCKRLAACLRHGVAFHHAGLLGKQKGIIEDNFRNGLLKAIVATPTLAMGLNLPAFRVIIRDVKRYYESVGLTYIPVLDYKQMIGRAGRPQYDSFGEAIVLAKDEDDARDLADRYIMGEPEEIRSKLAVEPILRMHTLAMVASEFVKTEEALQNFFSKTFYAHQYGSIDFIEEKVSEILEKLEEWKFVTRSDGKLSATLIGKRISELYVDPLTAFNFIEAIKMTDKRRMEPFSFLQTVSNSIEMRPLLTVRTGEISEIENVSVERAGSVLQEIPEEWDLGFEEFFKSIKTATFFESWINETTEEQILTKFNVAPGELRNKLLIADWLLYSLHELSLLLDKKDALHELRKLRVRMTYGIREELLPLVKLEQVGRVRARKLWNANLKTLEDLRKVSVENLSKVVGPQVSAIIKKQVEGKQIDLNEDKQATVRKFER